MIAVSTYLYFTASVLYSVVGLRFWIRRRSESAHRYFLAFCLCFTLWSFGYGMHGVSSAPIAMDIWRRVGFCGALTYAVFILLFFLFHTGTIKQFRRRWILYSAIWVLPGLFLYENLVNNAVYESFPTGFWYIGLHVLSNLYNLFSIVLILIWVHRSKLKREQKQGWIIILGGLVTITITIISDFLMGLAGRPTLTPVFILVWIASISFASWKYRFLGISAPTVASKVLEQIDDLVAVVDSSINVVLLNRRLSENSQLFVGSEFSDAFVDPKRVREHFKHLLKSDLHTLPVRFSLANGTTRIPVSGRLSVVEDRFGDLLGVLFVARELIGIRGLKAVYRLTDRELTIVDELSTGNSNRVISHNLFIAENTVKAHITNIYNKLGITNRVELINLIDELGIRNTGTATANLWHQQAPLR